MTLKLSTFLNFIFFLVSISSAAQKKVDSFYSTELSRKMDILLITPESKIDQVIWLLHGYNGSVKTWASFSELTVWADKYNIAFVCPSAFKNGWYLDSPTKSRSNVKTYLIAELPQWLKTKGLLLPRHQQWAIGVSMGGHGVLTLSLANPQLWAGVSSIAGITELEAFPNNWEIKSHLGTFSDTPELWYQHSFNSLLRNGATPQVYLVLDCGKSDFAFEVNKKTDSLLSSNGIPHQFWSESGKHNFEYVTKVMKKHIEFSVNYLKTNNSTHGR